MAMENKHSFLTIRSLVIGLSGLLVITASSMYVALRMGALPWPTVFVTVVSMAALKKAKNSSLQEINITHTIMSAGAMVAGGLAFTLPGIWILNPSAAMPTFQIVVVTVTGALLGTVFTALFRQRLIEEEKLPYPMGIASYNTLEAGSKGGKGAATLFTSMGASAAFTALRDGAGIIPAVVTPFKGTALFPALSIWVSPMAMGIGAVIGPVLSLVWFLGTIIGYYIITPIGLATGLFENAASADIFRSNLGIGLMIGTGLGVFVKAIFDLLKRKQEKKTLNIKKDKAIPVVLVMVFAVIILSSLTSIRVQEAVVLVLGVFLTTYLSSTLTGQTGVNPMEIFGMLVLLLCSLLFKPEVVPSFLIAAVTAVACGLAGDVMNDLKSGSLIGTPAKDQIIGEGIGGVVGAIVSAFVIIIMAKAFGGFGTAELPAPQASAVAAMVGGLGNYTAFFIGLGIGMILYLLKVPAATLGLGVYLPSYISSIMAIGAVAMLGAKKLFKKEKAEENGALISSGLLGGEGITGVIIAIIAIFNN